MNYKQIKEQVEYYNYKFIFYTINEKIDWRTNYDGITWGNLLMYHDNILYDNSNKLVKWKGYVVPIILNMLEVDDDYF